MPSTVTEVVLDKHVLNAFRRRALRSHPRELLEQLVGKVVNGQARIYALRDIEHEGQQRAIILDDDVNPMTENDGSAPYSVLGTIHTHPQDTVDPSELDWASMREDGEIVMGICAIRLSKKRRFTTLAFWRADGTAVPWTVGETI